MCDCAVSVVVVAGVVLFSDFIRKVSKSFKNSVYINEICSTFQLCACAHELRLLGERVCPHAGLSLLYICSVIHMMTFSGALCNPAAALELLYRGSVSPAAALRLMTCELCAALLARCAAGYLWSVGLSDLHTSHSSAGHACADPLSVSLCAAAGVEMICTFVLQTAVIITAVFTQTLRVHIISAVITLLVYTGGSSTGAVMNPALAVSLQFSCSGHTLLEYVCVYWLGPILGVACAVMLFEKFIPSLMKRNSDMKKLQ